MTALTPEAVAQMVADMADGLDMAAEAEVLVIDGLEKYVTMFQADDRDPKTMRALRVYTEAKSNHRRFVNEAYALRTLAAENATLRHDRDVAVVNNDVLRIAMDTLRAERDDLKSAMTPTPDAELDAFVDFMCGAGEFDGAWFGDAHHSLSGHFWWRTRLRKTIATLRASEAAALERVKVLEAALLDASAMRNAADRVSQWFCTEARQLEGPRIQGLRMAIVAYDRHMQPNPSLTPTADKE